MNTQNEQQYINQYYAKNHHGKHPLGRDVVREINRLRLMGWTHKAIGEYLGISETSARKYDEIDPAVAKQAKRAAKLAAKCTQ